MKPALLLAEQLLAKEAHLKGLPGFVIVNYRWNMAQFLPVAEDGPDAGAGLFAQAQPAERGDDVRVARLFLAGLQEFTRADKGVTRVPKQCSIAKEADAGLASMVAVILMEQQVNGGLAKGNIVRRVVIAPKGRHIYAERPFGAPHIAFGEGEPGKDQVLFHNDAVAPATIRRPGIELGIDELAVHHWPRKRLANIAAPAQNQHGGPGGRKAAAMLRDKPPLAQELHV